MIASHAHLDDYGLAFVVNVDIRQLEVGLAMRFCPYGALLASNRYYPGLS